MVVNSTGIMFNYTNFTSPASTPVNPTTTTEFQNISEKDGVIALLIIACLCSSLWLIYMTFYHSRLLGFIITEFVNFKYMKEGQYFKIGSLSLSILSGKIMFRDVKYITKDLSFRVVDGYAILKYWLPLKPEEPRKPYSLGPSNNEPENGEQRLNIWLNCFEYHVYSRSGLYKKLENLFRVERYGDAAKSTQNILNVINPKEDVETGKEELDSSSSALPLWLLELIPAIKFDINTCKVAFGNKLFETTLGIQFESAAGLYTTSQSNSSLDHFMHLVKCNGRNVRVMLFPSPGYNASGPRDEPPRYMGDGFVVVQTALCKATYYQDEPGFVPESKGTGEEEIPDSDPNWGMEIVFVKSTSICYGPWVDRQREALQKFFYPLDYQEMAVTKPLQPGQRRIHTGLDIKFDFEADASLDILFSKNQETRAVHVCVGAGSHIGVYQPWTVNDYGYTTSVVTKLYRVDASTSMSYRQLVEADTLELAVHMSFPRIWNQMQHWTCDVNVSKVTWYFIFAHKWYFQEMIEDWTANYRADLLTFVPYEWQFNIVLHDFEMIWIANQYNYIECSSNRQENAELAFCGEVFDLTFVLQFLRFLPEIEEIKFFLQVEKLVARVCLPEYDTLRRSFLSLARSSNKRHSQTQGVRSRSSTTTAIPEEGVDSADETTGPSGATDETTSSIFRRYTDITRGWVDTMSVPILGLSLGYMYHPIIPNSKYDISREKCLLWEPTDMEPDVITLELEAGPAALRLFGSLFKILAGIKENYFGVNQVFQECASLATAKGGTKVFPQRTVTPEPTKDSVNMFSLRPLDANIYLSLYDFKTELTKHCGVNESTCPLLIMERFSFEMHKTYTETRLQLHLTPITILVSDGNERGMFHQPLSQGHLSLSGFQLRGHAMFSGLGLPPDSDTLEYAWLMELQFGILSGKVTLPQLQSLLNWGQTFVFHLLSKENSFQPPTSYQRCIHGKMQNDCQRRLKSRKAVYDANEKEELEITEVEKKGHKSAGVDSKGSKSGGTESKGTSKGHKSIGADTKGLRASGVGDTEPESARTLSELCITEDDIKYRMSRVSVENIDLFIVETGVACNLEVSPVRLATCNLHCDDSSTGMSVFVQTIKLRQFVLAPVPSAEDPMLGDVHKRISMCDDVIWLEAATVQLGPIISDFSMASTNQELQHDQKDFLEMHDNNLQRLWFLWQPSDQYPDKRHNCCACMGGCNFFGKNMNGARFFIAEKLDASYNDTGIGGFGSEGGFYDDGDLHDDGSRPLMYSRDALGSSYMDASPVGSVEAFTRKRYRGSESSCSPKLKPANARNLHEMEACLDEDLGDGSGPASRLSWGSSLQRVSSSISNMHNRMKYMRTTSLQGSRQSLTRKPSKPSVHPPLRSCSSQHSHGSEGSFYSCGSLLDDLEDGTTLYKAGSAESFISAVEFPHDLIQFEDEQTYMSRFVVSCPLLVSRYSQQLSQLECLNWSMPPTVPSGKRLFSIAQNLKITDPSENFIPPGVPQFNYQNSPKLELPFLVKKYHGQRERRSHADEADVSSSSSGSVFMGNRTVIKMASPQEKVGRSKETGSSEIIEQSEQDSVRKARWKSAMNEGDVISVSSTDTTPVGSLTRKGKVARQNTVVLRLDGDINILVTPLLMEALQRYAASVSRQDKILHPAMVADLVHDKCTDAAELMYHKRLAENLVPAVSNEKITDVPPQEPELKQMVALISTSKINMCFIQAAIPEMESKIENDSKTECRDPSVSLLAGSISGITSEIMSVQKAATDDSEENTDCKECRGCKDRMECRERDAKKDAKVSDEKRPSVVEIQSQGNGNMIKKKVHRNTSTIGSIKCSQVQLQLRKLCNKEDIENSVTTAIPEQASKAKFHVNGRHLQGFMDNDSTDDLAPGSCLSLLMLECGLDNIHIQGGSECGNGKEILPKIRRRRHFIHRETKRRVNAADVFNDKEKAKPKEDEEQKPGFHGFSNPIFTQESGSVDMNITLSENDHKSVDSRLSSLTSSLSFLTSSSGGNMSDIESEVSGDEDVTKPLLKPEAKEDNSKGRQGGVVFEQVSPKTKDAELARRVDVTVNVSSIWFNLASPSSLKTVPSNYHLYNSLVTTMVPLTMAWVPRVLELQDQLSVVERNRHRHLTSVIACLMSQALPEHGRIPKKHGVHYLMTRTAQILQDDHSSQLIYILRRQLIGSRLNKVRTSLAIRDGIPEDNKLTKGIFALARQWKCFLAGTERGEILFYGSNSIKKRVVGRGVLTERDRAILMKEESHGREALGPIPEPVSEVTSSPEPVDKNEVKLDMEAETKQEDNDSSTTPGQTTTQSPRTLTLPISPVILESSPHTDHQREPLLPSTNQGAPPDSETDSDESPPNTMPRDKHLATSGGETKKPGHKKQLSLYSWLSNTPTTSPNTGRLQHVTSTVERKAPSKPSSHATQDKSDHSYDLFGDMVSVPTSGKQIQDERETFKTVLQAINLMPKVAKDEDTASTVTFNTKLKYLHVDLVDGGFDNLSKNKKGKGKGKNTKTDDKPKVHKQLFTDVDPIFLAKDFTFRIVRDKTPCSDMNVEDSPSRSHDSTKVTSIKFNIGCGNITQRVNLSFVRLSIQLVDMMDLLLSYTESKMVEDAVDGPAPVFTTLFTPGKRHNPQLPPVKCWKIMNQVLDLYSSLPREAKTKGFLKRTTSGRSFIAERSSPDRLRDVRIDMEDGPRRKYSVPVPQGVSDKRRSVVSRTTWDSKSYDQEDGPAVSPSYTIFGVIILPKTRLLATIGGLVLEAEIRDVSTVITRREERDGQITEHLTGSVSAHLGIINIVLLEKVRRQTRMVVSCHLSRSHALYTSASDRDSEKNLALLTLGVIDIDIPQHPVALHTMMTRSSRTISRHITDIQMQRSVIRSMGSFDNSSPRISRRISGVPAEFVKHHLVSPSGFKTFSPIDSVDGKEPSVPRITFNVVLKGFTLGASLLPSLRAGYRIGKISASGRTGKSSLFKASMPSHSLMFSSKVQSVESNIPSSTEVELPPVTVSGDFVSKLRRPVRREVLVSPEVEQLRVYRHGTKGHLCAAAEIGSFQHSLTTDLLNHLVFVQKSFMKEVNDVLQRVSGESQPVPLWRTASAESIDSSKEKEIPVLYSFRLTLKGIQVTATTPSATAVRLDTGVVSLEVSNAIPSSNEPGELKRSGSFVKLFGKAQVDVNLSLGQFMKSRMIDDELEFVQMAYFKTKIGVRNSFQDVSSMHGTEDKETFLVTLTQPKIYAQQVAFDKAVLVYLNYKNAYEHWNEERMALNEEVHTATQAVLEKLPARSHAAQLSGSLFLQLTVDRLGICVPLYNGNQGAAQAFQMKSTYQEPSEAMVLSVDEMMLSCCSSASLVSKGKFNKFCLWFADKFDTEAMEWRPDLTSRLMNTCIVSQGTYELCSKTVRYPISPDVAKTGKWVMSVRWQMCGVEVHCDTDIGKRLSSLGNTMTAVVGETDIANMESVTEVTDKDMGQKPGGEDEVDYKDGSRAKQNTRNVEKDMWEQARKVNELRRRGDVKNWIVEREMRILQDLENAVFNEFRKDVRKKLRRTSRGRSAHVRRVEGGKQPLHDRKAMSERARHPRRDTRLRDHISEDFNESDNEGSEMVDLSSTTSSPIKRGDLFLNNTDIPILNEPDEPDVSPDDSSLNSSRNISPSLPDVLNVGAREPLLPRTSEDQSPYGSTPYNRDALTVPGGPRVTFSTSSTDIQDQSAASQRSSLLPQQNLDFELDVTVDIESGKCVLHPASEGDKEDSSETSYRPSAKKLLAMDPSKSKLFSPMYPTSTGGRRYKSSAQDINYQSKDTVLLLPGVDVRVKYSSSFDAESMTSSSPPSTPGSSWTTSTTLMTDGSGLSTLVGSEPRASYSQQSGVFDTPRQSTASGRKVVKSAGLYIWVSFQSLPQEMVLKPSLIDFLEQALEPIIVPGGDEEIDGEASMSDDGSDDEIGAGGSLVSSSMSEYSSFPVDVVVVVRVQPSNMRFSCLPVSKVECMLRLPALDVVFSSKSSPNKYILQSPSQRPFTRDQSQAKFSDTPDTPTSAHTFDSGGISFTVCLSSFSFCIFHPYGKQHTGLGRAASAPAEGDPEASEEARPRFRYIPTQPISGKKDSLSLDVEFVKFNLSRRRVGSSVGSEERGSRGGSPDLLAGISSSTVVKVSGICDIGSAAFNYDMRRLNEILDFPKAWYKRSLVSRLFLGKEGSYAAKSQAMGSDVPDAPPMSSKIDLEQKRRSSPIMTEMDRPIATPSRPMLSRSMSEEERRPARTFTPLKIPSKPKSVQKKSPSGPGGFFSFLPTSPSLFRSMTMSGTRYGLLSPAHPSQSLTTPKRQTTTEARRRKEEKPLHLVLEQSSSDTEVDGPLSQSSSSSAGSKSKWETVIIVALNLSRLDVNTNMGSVMGQTVWSTSDIRTQSHLTLTNTGRRQLRAKLNIRQAFCESRSGIVGGHMEIHELVSKANVTEERGCSPEHLVNLNLRYAEARIDYMGTCILMGNISAFKTDLRDEWTLQEASSPSTDVLFEREREEPVKAKIYIHGNMTWTDFKLMISRSTTPDLVKMMAKIQEFFTQQHRNSIRALSTLRPPTQLNTGNILSSLAAPVSAAPHIKDKDAEKDGLKYQHWSKVLNAVSGLKLSMLGNPLPERGVVLGGSLTLHGKTVSLACFHGVNFRAQSWVLFTFYRPHMEFVSKVCSEEKSCQVRRVRAVQELLLRLGNGDSDEDQPGNMSPTSSHMAIVRKVSRGRRNPPSMGSNVQEWLSYVCATGEDDISPSDEEPQSKQRTDSLNSVSGKKSSRSRTGGYRYEHDSEPIFALPRFEVDLKTEHDMPMSANASSWVRRKLSVGASRILPSPSSPHVVECTFSSCFDDSLCVTMDVGLLFFLHDVVQTYIRENETTTSGSLPRGLSPPTRVRKQPSASDKEDREKTPKAVDQQKRIRQFRSKSWKLEPKVRFMSWAGKNMDPVNMDWVLQKLGFTHARLTIPKWAQRGAMDPMDVFLSVLIDRLFAGMQESSAYLDDER